MYSNLENRYSIELKYMIDQKFSEYNIKVVIGQQSLFYLLGKMSKEIESIRCMSKERLFFSQSFLQLVESVEYRFEWKAYPLFEFEDAIKHKIIELFIVKYICMFYQFSTNLMLVIHL